MPTEPTESRRPATPAEPTQRAGWWQAARSCESCGKPAQARSCTDRMRDLCDGCWQGFRLRSAAHFAASRGLTGDAAGEYSRRHAEPRS